MTIALDDFGFAGQRRTTDGLDRGLCSYLTPARAEKKYEPRARRKWRPQTSDLIGRLNSGRGVGVARYPGALYLELSLTCKHSAPFCLLLVVKHPPF